MGKKSTFLGTREGSRSHYNHVKFSTNYKSQALIQPLLWLLSSGQYGQSLSVMCRPMNLVPLWGEKENQSNPSNQQSAWDPSARASHVPLQPEKKGKKKKKKGTRLVKSGSWRHSIAAAGLWSWTVQHDKTVVGCSHHRHLPVDTFNFCHLHLNAQSIQAFPLMLTPQCHEMLFGQNQGSITWSIFWIYMKGTQCSFQQAFLTVTFSLR